MTAWVICYLNAHISTRVRLTLGGISYSCMQLRKRPSQLHAGDFSCHLHPASLCCRPSPLPASMGMGLEGWAGSQGAPLPHLLVLTLRFKCVCVWEGHFTGLGFPAQPSPLPDGQSWSRYGATGWRRAGTWLGCLPKALPWLQSKLCEADFSSM